MHKKLYRSRTDKKLAGVCGGLANYLGIDPTVIRVIWAILAPFAFPAILAYAICMLVMPEEPDYTDVT